MSDFKEFLASVADGDLRRDLFLYPNKALREGAVKTLFNAAGERGLCPIVRSSDHSVLIDGSVAVIRIAHPHIDRELRGLVWTAVHGLDALDPAWDTKGITANLLAMVR